LDFVKLKKRQKEKRRQKKREEKLLTFTRRAASFSWQLAREKKKRGNGETKKGRS
jgi:hypothetical protein